MLKINNERLSFKLYHTNCLELLSEFPEWNIQTFLDYGRGRLMLAIQN